MARLLLYAGLWILVAIAATSKSDLEILTYFLAMAVVLMSCPFYLLSIPPAAMPWAWGLVIGLILIFALRESRSGRAANARGYASLAVNLAGLVAAALVSVAHAGWNLS